MTAQAVCAVGYAATVRDVSQATRDAVFHVYGLVPGADGYELDHLIPLELGGANSIANLWPEPYDGAGGAHDKDTTENALHAEVCAGHLALDAAQRLAVRWWDAPAGAFADCDAARAAGAAPLRRGDPGYRPELDGDGDGVACE